MGINSFQPPKVQYSENPELRKLQFIGAGPKMSIASNDRGKGIIRYIIMLLGVYLVFVVLFSLFFSLNLSFPFFSFFFYARSLSLFVSHGLL